MVSIINDVSKSKEIVVTDASIQRSLTKLKDLSSIISQTLALSDQKVMIEIVLTILA